jgi:hypothetical protein
MGSRDEMRRFLAACRAKVSPQEAGLPAGGGTRRGKGLRREEVARLAGVSLEEYAAMERGTFVGVSPGVLAAVARVLCLDDSERARLVELAGAVARRPGPQARRRHPGRKVRPGVRRVLEAMVDVPAFVRNGRLDVLATNALARALYAPVFDNSANRGNLGRFRFLDDAAGEFYPDWHDSAGSVVDLLRAEAARDPYQPELTELIGELSTRSEEFGARWAARGAGPRHTGVKRFRHPVVGELTLGFEAMPLPVDPGLTLVVFHAEPGTASHDGLRLLASWSATHVPDAMP